MSCSKAVQGLQYIADSPPQAHGGFHPQAVRTAKAAIKELRRLREALLLYHEAWNGCEGDWHKAMKTASANANHVLWPKEYDEDGQKRQMKRRAK